MHDFRPHVHRHKHSSRLTGCISGEAIADTHDVVVVGLGLCGASCAGLRHTAAVPGEAVVTTEGP